MNSDYVNQILSTFIEVELPDKDAFLKIKETLTRIGIASNREKKLYQSCHILHKKGKYYIVHFKELFALDGRKSTMCESDVARRNTIAKLLQEWDLCFIVGFLKSTEEKDSVFPSTMQEFCPLNKIKVLSFYEKDKWELVSKYSIGKKKYTG